MLDTKPMFVVDVLNVSGSLCFFILIYGGESTPEESIFNFIGYVGDRGQVGPRGACRANAMAPGRCVIM